jgi:hypothetical protein
MSREIWSEILKMSREFWSEILKNEQRILVKNAEGKKTAC